MIGHVFASSGATLLALAPATTRPDEYKVFAVHEGGYAVAVIYADMLTSDAERWVRGDYFSSDQFNDAVEAFGEDIGRTDFGPLAAAIRHAEEIVEHRTHLASH